MFYTQLLWLFDFVTLFVWRRAFGSTLASAASASLPVCVAHPLRWVKMGSGGNVGAPGTGMSYRTRLSGSPSHQRLAQREQQRQSDRAASLASELTAFKAILDEKGQVTLVDQEGQTLSASLRRMVWSGLCRSNDNLAPVRDGHHQR